MKNYYRSADSMNTGHSTIGKTTARCQGDSGSFLRKSEKLERLRHERKFKQSGLNTRRFQLKTHSGQVRVPTTLLAINETAATGNFIDATSSNTTV